MKFDLSMFVTIIAALIVFQLINKFALEKVTEKLEEII